MGMLIVGANFFGSGKIRKFCMASFEADSGNIIFTSELTEENGKKYANVEEQVRALVETSPETVDAFKSTPIHIVLDTQLHTILMDSFPEFKNKFVSFAAMYGLDPVEIIKEHTEYNAARLDDAAYQVEEVLKLVVQYTIFGLLINRSFRKAYKEHAQGFKRKRTVDEGDGLCKKVKSDNEVICRKLNIEGLLVEVKQEEPEKTDQK